MDAGECPIELAKGRDHGREALAGAVVELGMEAEDIGDLAAETAGAQIRCDTT